MSDGTPWSKFFRDLVAASEEGNCFALGVPHRGSIDRLIVSQESGSLDGYTIDIYDTVKVCETDGEFSSISDSSGSHDLHKIFATKTTTGKLLEDFDAGYTYVNQDGTPTNPQRKLYLKISPLGSGNKSFDVALTIQPPLLI